MLESVQIRDPKRVFELYPHEVSGGMGQRIMIAMMLMPEPSLLIADEPTSALDVTVRMRVLAILDELAAQRELGVVHARRGTEHGRHRRARAARSGIRGACPGGLATRSVRDENTVDAKLFARRTFVGIRAMIAVTRPLFDRHDWTSIRPASGLRPSP
jgi:hypothetical protein